jgi:hypothetical protein
MMFVNQEQQQDGEIVPVNNMSAAVTLFFLATLSGSRGKCRQSCTKSHEILTLMLGLRLSSRLF